MTTAFWADERRVHTFQRISVGAGTVAVVGLAFLLNYFVQAPHGRDAFLVVAERALGVGYWLVLLPLVVNVVMGALVAVAQGRTGQVSAYPSPGLGRVQFFARFAVLGFALVYFLQVVSARGEATDPAGIYDVLRSTLGRPLYLGLYAIGTTTVAYYVAVGVWTVARWLWPEDEAKVALVRWLGFGIACALWLMSVNVLAYFATGRAFIQPSDTASLTDRVEESSSGNGAAPHGVPPRTAMPTTSGRTTARPQPLTSQPPPVSNQTRAPGPAVSSPPPPAPSSQPR